jgi:transcription initiation factor IIE alpha subunit
MTTQAKSKSQTEAENAVAADNSPSKPRPASKIDQVTAMLERKQGATLAEMTDVTGWQPHSARAVLTGLRKKGHVIVKSKRDDVTCYRITVAD